MPANYQPEGHQVFGYQISQVLNQAAPVQNSWYALLGTTNLAGTVTTGVRNALVYAVDVNVEDADETLEVRWIVDGVTIPANDQACAHSTTYRNYMLSDAINRIRHSTLTNAVTPVQRAFILYGLDVAVQIRKTTALGAGNLTGISAWGQVASA